MTTGSNNLGPPSDTKDIEHNDSTGFDQDDGLTHSSALAVMFASSVPTPDNLAQLKQKKKVFLLTVLILLVSYTKYGMVWYGREWCGVVWYGREGV